MESLAVDLEDFAVRRGVSYTITANAGGTKARDGVSTYFRLENATTGDWEVVFSTTPADDWDTFLTFRDSNGNADDTDNELVSNTPHTQEVTSNDDDGRLDLRVRDYAHSVPTAATLRINPPATDSDFWDVFAERGQAGTAGARGADGQPGDGYQWRGAWSNTTTYAVRDVVHHDRSAWVATQASTNQTPSGSSAHWDLFAEHGEKGDKGDTGPVGPVGPPGEDGGAADRAPGLFQIPISEAQQTSLTSANDFALPAALVTLANNATPGGNKIGDFVRFYRNTYSDYWTWTDRATDRWERTLDFLGAAQIQTVDISAITGNFADLNVSGVLTANKIEAENLSGLFALWTGVQTIGPRGTHRFNLPTGYDLDDFIAVVEVSTEHIDGFSNFIPIYYATPSISTTGNDRVKTNTGKTQIIVRNTSNTVNFHYYGFYGISGEPRIAQDIPISTIRYNVNSLRSGYTGAVTATFSSTTGVVEVRWQYYSAQWLWDWDTVATARTVSPHRRIWGRRGVSRIRVTWVQNGERQYGPNIPVS